MYMGTCMYNVYTCSVIFYCVLSMHTSWWVPEKSTKRSTHKYKNQEINCFDYYIYMLIYGTMAACFKKAKWKPKSNQFVVEFRAVQTYKLPSAWSIIARFNDNLELVFIIQKLVSSTCTDLFSSSLVFFSGIHNLYAESMHHFTIASTTR